MDTNEIDNDVIEEALTLIEGFAPFKVNEMLQGELTGYLCLAQSAEGTYVFIINLFNREKIVAAKGDDQTISTVVMASDITVRKWLTAASEPIIVSMSDDGRSYELSIEYRRATPDTITGLKEILQAQLQLSLRV